MLPGEYAQKAQVGSGFDAFLFSRFASLDDGLLLLLRGRVGIVGWWRPGLDGGSGGVLVVVGGFGAGAAHCLGVWRGRLFCVGWGGVWGEV